MCDLRTSVRENAANRKLAEITSYSFATILSLRVDYAGLFGIIPFVGYSQRIRKHYVAVFVYLATKAIHLDSMEDYSFLPVF